MSDDPSDRGVRKGMSDKTSNDFCREPLTAEIADDPVADFHSPVRRGPATKAGAADQRPGFGAGSEHDEMKPPTHLVGSLRKPGQREVQGIRVEIFRWPRRRYSGSEPRRECGMTLERRVNEPGCRWNNLEAKSLDHLAVILQQTNTLSNTIERQSHSKQKRSGTAKTTAPDLIRILIWIMLCRSLLLPGMDSEFNSSCRRRSKSRRPHVAPWLPRCR